MKEYHGSITRDEDFSRVVLYYRTIKLVCEEKGLSRVISFFISLLIYYSEYWIDGVSKRIYLKVYKVIKTQHQSFFLMHGRMNSNWKRIAIICSTHSQITMNDDCKLTEK